MRLSQLAEFESMPLTQQIDDLLNRGEPVYFSNNGQADEVKAVNLDKDDRSIVVGKKNRRIPVHSDTYTITQNDGYNIIHKIDETISQPNLAEQEAGVSKDVLECVLISYQSDIFTKDLIPEHRMHLIDQHNQLMEVYEQLESGELTEDRLDEVVPLAALGGMAARAALGYAARSAAGQALKRGAIAGMRKATGGLKRMVRGKGKRGKDVGDFGGDDAPTQFAKDLGIAGSGTDSDDMVAKAASAGLSANDIALIKKGFK